MRIHRSFAVTRRVFKELRNDKRTLALIFIAPIFVMFVFGLAFSGDVKNVHVIVVNNDEGFTDYTGNNVSLSEQVISNLDKEVLDIEYASNVNAAVNRVKNGDACAVIVFPKILQRTYT